MSPLQVRMAQLKIETAQLIKDNEDQLLILAEQPGASAQVREVAAQIRDRRNSPR